MKQRIRQSAALIAYLACLSAAFAGAFLFVDATDPDSGPAAVAADVPASPVPSAVLSPVPSAVLSPELSPEPTVAPSQSPGPSPPPVPADPGFVLALDRSEVGSGSPEPLRVQVLGPDGRPRQLVARAGGALRLAVVRTDLTEYQELSPEPDGVDAWTAPLMLAAPGPYRVLAEVQPEGAYAPLVLAADLLVAGDYLAVALPPPGRMAAMRNYLVTMFGEPRPGVEAELMFTVTENGAPVPDLVPIGAGSPDAAVGTLAALRADDLAGARVSPRTLAAPGTPAGSDMRFAVTFPAAGTYRLFLDFQRAGGSRHSVGFTLTVLA